MEINAWFPGAQLADLVFDGALGLLVLATALTALHARQLYSSIVLFIAFGLLMALIWARLGAADLALAEAAIGAGLTGVLLFSALASGVAPDITSGAQGCASGTQDNLPATQDNLPGAQGCAPGVPGRTSWLLLLLTLLVAMPLVWALLPLPQGESKLPAQVAAHMADSGVDHPVTAVLLNFRAWDTLLELLVVLLALLGVRQLPQPSLSLPKPWPLLLAWSRGMAPLTVLVGGYLLWRGAFAPGGAFQAGAILAAGAVMLRLNLGIPRLYWRRGLIRALLLLGLMTFTGVGLATALFGAGFLHYPAAWSGVLILVIEVAATLSIAASLTLMVVGDGEELQR